MSGTIGLAKSKGHLTVKSKEEAGNEWRQTRGNDYLIVAEKLKHTKPRRLANQKCQHSFWAAISWEQKSINQVASIHNAY